VAKQLQKMGQTSKGSSRNNSFNIDRQSTAKRLAMMLERREMSSGCLRPEQDQIGAWQRRFKGMPPGGEKTRAVVRDSVERARHIFVRANDFIGCGNCYFELVPARICG